MNDRVRTLSDSLRTQADYLRRILPTANLSAAFFEDQARYMDNAADTIESLQAEVKNLTERNHHLHSRLTYEKAQRIALTERLQELDPSEEVHGT